MKLFARHRLAGPAKSALSDQQLAITWQVASLLLDYPTPEGRAALPQLAELVAGLPEPVCSALGSLIAHVGTGELADRQQEYVDTFDHTRRNCLYLTYYAYGDTRRRGVALVQFKQAFQKAGVEFNDSELPDHLGAVLEFGATVDRAVAWKLINDYRAGLEMLRLALERRNSPYAGAAVAVCATLPMLNGDEADAVNRLIAEGPPAQVVTPEVIADVFGVTASVIVDPESGTPVVMPRRRAS